ncbi:YitT family protein [Pseudocolwellia sp. HL-MZ19]|uniref:YitT family protein n=1 Tax=Pseudocolwellia sp. HL-MZ19 TaxID=3400846 RepID=UPI003CF7FE17
MTEFIKNSILIEIKNILLITLGSALLAFGISTFLLPAQLATGGTPGISIIIHYLTNMNVSLAMLMINIPLIIAGSKFVAPSFAIRTIYSVSITSLFIAIYPYLYVFPKISDMLLSALYGGGCIGVGVGLILKGQASAGGTTIIAKIISNFSSIKPAQIILVLDVIIIITIAIIYRDFELALWSLMSIYVTTKTIDKILSGSVSEKVVHIVSEHTKEIGYKISEELKRKGTILTGQSLQKERAKKVLFVVIGSREVEKLKIIVHQIDEHALVIEMEASEIMGSSLLT